MGRVAYSITDAAEASAAPKHIIEAAVRSGELPAKRIDSRAVILRQELTEWLLTQPDWIQSRGVSHSISA